jgi:hypothetical protein
LVVVFANAPSTCIVLWIQQSLKYNKKFFFQDKMIKEGQRHHQEGQGSIPVKKERRRITKYSSYPAPTSKGGDYALQVPGSRGTTTILTLQLATTMVVPLCRLRAPVTCSHYQLLQPALNIGGIA